MNSWASPSPDFRLLLIGQSASQLGTQVAAVALPLLAITVLHATALQVGLLNAVSTAAFAVLALPAGEVVDRRARRPLLIAADLVRAAVLASIPLAAGLGGVSMAQLIVVCLLVGAARAFFDVGYRSYLPSVVGMDRVLSGNSVMEVCRAGGQVVGPGMGGWLVSALGPAEVVSVQAATFMLSAGALAAVRAREAHPPRGSVQHRPRGAALPGLRWLLGHPVLRATALAGALSNMAFAIASAVSVIFMVRTLRMSPTLIGSTLSAGSLTVLVGAAAVPFLARRVGSARVIWLCLAWTAPFALVGIAAQPGWAVVLVLVSTAAGELGQIVFAISSLSLRQRVCPADLLGRVNAAMQVLVIGLFPLGALLGGALGDLIGPRATLAVSGAMLLACPVLLRWAFRGARDVEQVGAIDG